MQFVALSWFCLSPLMPFLWQHKRILFGDRQVCPWKAHNSQSKKRKKKGLAHKKSKSLKTVLSPLGATADIEQNWKKPKVPFCAFVFECVKEVAVKINVSPLSSRLPAVLWLWIGELAKISSLARLALGVVQHARARNIHTQFTFSVKHTSPLSTGCQNMSCLKHTPAWTFAACLLRIWRGGGCLLPPRQLLPCLKCVMCNVSRGGFNAADGDSLPTWIQGNTLQRQNAAPTMHTPTTHTHTCVQRE